MSGSAKRPVHDLADAFGYPQLPESMKLLYTPEQWAWLGADQRAVAVERECLPDVAED